MRDLVSLRMVWIALALLVVPLAEALHLEIMVASPWKNLERRNILRQAFLFCKGRLSMVLQHSKSGPHAVTHHFFMGEVNDTQPDADELLKNDLVLLGGPDTDPPVRRDATYVLPRPTARGYRIAYASKWIMDNMPEVDYVMYLDDDAFLNVPLLIMYLEIEEKRYRGNQPGRSAIDHIETLVLGYMMETDLDMSKYDVCEVCRPCEACQKDKGLQQLCAHLPKVSLGGCVWHMSNCQMFHDVESENSTYTMEQCIQDSHRQSTEIAEYFGSKRTPLWLLGMGWVFGRQIFSYVGRNADVLKKRGAADVQLGYWLAALEDIYWVDMAAGSRDGKIRFHDFPMGNSTFSISCHSESILVHRMTPERWHDYFDERACQLNCPSTLP